MADDQHEVRNILWSEVFSFTNIFKGFRMAIHLGKLLLAMGAIMVVFGAGWVMDRFWSMGGSYAGANIGGQDEISCFFLAKRDQFDKAKQDWLDNRQKASVDLRVWAADQASFFDDYRKMLPPKRQADDDAVSLVVDRAAAEADKGSRLSAAFEAQCEKNNIAKPRAEAKAYKDEEWASLIGESRGDVKRAVNRIENHLAAAIKDVQDEIGKLKTEEEKKHASEQLEKDHGLALQAVTRLKQAFSDRVDAIRGRTIYSSLSSYESECLSRAMSALWRGDVTGGLNTYQQIVRGQQQALPNAGDAGFLFWVLAATTGVAWLFATHWVYAILLAVIVLAVWAIFGGAIHRMAALHAAREEKISIGQALRFSLSKFRSFFFAPLIPLTFASVAGALLMLGGLVGNLYGFGAIMVGVLFFLAVLLGLAIAFLMVGLITGWSLMYPTIAVEGSDCFDAISRSFSYVFARPWRAGLYAVVAAVYGLACYMFVRFFAYVALSATHFFTKVGIWSGGDSLAGASDKLDVMWTAPTFSQFHAPFNWEAMSTAEAVGAFCIAIWVYLVIGLVLAFALSYCASSSTVIYYLLRRKVDATDLDDVYIEEVEDQPAAATNGASASAAVETPVAAAPAGDVPQDPRHG